MEFRHRSLLAPDVSERLAAHQVALVCADYAGLPRRFELTADFVYLRLIGRHGAYPDHHASQADRTAEIARWADALRANQTRYQAAYVFCNNDYEGYAPLTCDRLKNCLGVPVSSPPPPAQGSLF